MEQYSQYLMLAKTNNSNIFMNPYSHNSWEEEAFAEDAQGPLGGFVWPPRSYSCTFCKRDFRSAQALGGHMNVHRRERAKLKQTTIAPQKKTLCKSLVQQSLDTNSDTKSCVYDEDLVVSGGNVVETNLVLGFGLDSCSSNAGRKRQRTAAGAPLIMEGLDLELRLACHLKQPNKLIRN